MTIRKRRSASKGTQKERVRRPNIERRGPIRNATTYLRDSNSWSEKEANNTSRKDGAGEHSAVGSLDDVVTQGVKLGYKVIEQYIAQGQRVAEQISRPFQKGMPEVGTADVVQGMVRVYKDMADVWGNALDLMVRNPAFWSWLGGSAQNAGVHMSKGPPGTLNGTGAAFSVEIASARTTEVMLNVGPSPEPYTPFVHALHAASRTAPPMTAISFQKSSRSNMPVLLLRIPSKQPAGLYTGVVVDKDTNQPRGTLTVRVLPVKR
jgi:hypothetical protein